MKVYIICFKNEHIAYPTAFLDREMAEECLKIMQDAHADKNQCKSYSDWYSVQEMEMERPLRLNTEETLKLLELLDKDANL